MADGKIEIEVILEDGNVKKTFAKVERESKSSGQKVGKNFEKGVSQSVGKGLESLRATALSVGGALVAAFGAREVIAAAARQEQAVNNLNASLRRIGEFSQEASQDLQNFASGLQSVTKFGDEAVLEQLAFAQSLGATAEQSKEIVAAAADLSAALGIDLNSATRNIARTLGGFAGELGEVIPELRNLSQEQLRAGEAIDLLAGKFQGFASQEVQTFSGAISQLSNSFGDLLESLGSIGTESGVVIGFIKDLSSGFSGLASTIRNAFAGEDPLKETEESIARLEKQIADVRQSISSAGQEQGFLASIFGGADVDALNARLSQLTTRLEQQKKVRDDLVQSQKESVATTRAQVAQVGVFEQALKNLKFSQEEAAMATQTFGEALNTQNQESFLPILQSIQALGFSAQELKTLLADQEFVESVAAGNEQLGTSFEGLVQSFQAQAKAIRVTNAQIAKSFTNTFARGIGNAFAAFGGALAQGENAFAAFGKVILGLLGDLSIQLGQGFILQGVARQIAGDPGGGALIAAGAALATFGGVLKSLGGGGGGLGAGASAGVSPSAGLGGAPSAGSGFDLASQPEPNTEPNTAVNVTIQGDVLDSEESGTRIVGLLNDAFEKQGVVISNTARFA